MPFLINRDFSYQVIHIGDDQSKLIIFDDFLNDVNDIVDAISCAETYKRDGQTAYPGLRTPLPDRYVDAVLSCIAPHITKVFDLEPDAKPQVVMAYGSSLNLRPSELTVQQSIPHFDSCERNYFAVLHYLKDGDFGGTGFFRHKPTKFEHISSDRKGVYLQSVNTFFAARGFPAPGYINKSTNHFELIESVGYKVNRLLIYPGWLLHSGLVDEKDVGINPTEGRLTANLFFRFT